MSGILNDVALEISARESKAYIDRKLNDIKDMATKIKGDKGEVGDKGEKGDVGINGVKGEKGDSLRLLNGLTGIWAGTQEEYEAIEEIDDSIYYHIRPNKPGGYVVFESEFPRTITPQYTNSGVTLQYSLDTENWINITSKSTTPESKTIYFRGVATGTKSLYSANSEVANKWTFSGDVNNKLQVRGNLNFLICDKIGSHIAPTTLDRYCYCYMFYGCTALTLAPLLPATTLGINCYQYMFYGCTSLVEPPILGAMNLANYCYYSMFYNCTSLSVAPELPATTLMSGCYCNMFQNCSSLLEGPELMGQTLVSYCYQYLFRGCSKLKSVTIHAINNLSVSYGLDNILTNVSSNGVLLCKPELNETLLKTPSGWIRENF